MQPAIYFRGATTFISLEVTLFFPEGAPPSRGVGNGKRPRCVFCAPNPQSRSGGWEHFLPIQRYKCSQPLGKRNWTILLGERRWAPALVYRSILRGAHTADLRQSMLGLDN